MINIPKELLGVKQWTVSYSLKELKRPLNSLYVPNGAWSYVEAKANAGKHKRMGFYVTPKDPYVLGDIDHVDHPKDREYLTTILPMGFCDLLFNNSIYSEVSPSGNGIRFIARLKSPEDKALLMGDYRKNRDPMGSTTENGELKKREAQINLGRPWQTITGNKTPYSSDRISVIGIETIMQLFNYKLKTADVVGTDYLPPPDISRSQLPFIGTITQALHSLPWDGNPRILRSFKRVFGEEFTSYEYWLKVIMAMSDYASKIVNPNDSLMCLEEVIKWSAKDEHDFMGEDEVVKKWESCMREESKVTYHTLLALAHYNELHWPQAKNPTKNQIASGITKATPIVAQYSNFKAMVDFYGMVLYRDANTPHKMYLTGDQDVLDKYFVHLDSHMYHGKYLGPWAVKSLIPKFSSMCQDHGYINVSSNHIAQHVAIWIGDINKTIDLVKLYFDTPYEDILPEYKVNVNDSISNIESLYGCLSVEYLTADEAKEEALYFRYYKSWLMGMARNIFFPSSQHMNNCVLLLTGLEQIRKTSHFKYILPEFMREERVAFTPHGFATEASVRDVTKLASMNNLVVWDEIEQFLDRETESNFKKLIDNNPVKIIDKYEVLDTYIRPIAIYGGTSNRREFMLSDNGNRRLFIIPITWVDTDTMAKMNWWKIINDLRDEIAGSDPHFPPWLLTEEELQFQTQLHGRMSAKSSLDLVLEDIFDFSNPWKAEELVTLPTDFDFRTSSYLWSSAQIATRLKRAGVTEKFSRKHLVNVLNRMCGKWTNTIRGVKTFKNSKVYVKKGEVYQAGRSKFWLPTLIKNDDKDKGGYFDDEDVTNY